MTAPMIAPGSGGKNLAHAPPQLSSPPLPKRTRIAYASGSSGETGLAAGALVPQKRAINLERAILSAPSEPFVPTQLTKTTTALVLAPGSGGNGDVRFSGFDACPELERYGLYIAPALHTIICLTCRTAIHLDSARSHLVSHNFREVPKKDKLTSLLLASGALPTSQITFPTDPIPPVLELDVIDGLQCEVRCCDHIATSLRSWQEHFQLKHPMEHAAHSMVHSSRAPPSPISVQILHSFHQDRVVLKVLPNFPQPVKTGGYNKYMARVALRPPAPPTYQLPLDKKLQSHFLSFTHFGSIIDGKDAGTIRGLVAPLPTHHQYHPLINGCRSYFKHIASKLPQVGDLFLRWIMTLKS